MKTKNVLQHLTTFIMDRKDAMLTIDDGIRKLRLLDAKGKVWTQEMLLQVDDKAVSLIDADSKVRKRKGFATLCSDHSDIRSFLSEILDCCLVQRYFRKKEREINAICRHKNEL